MIKMDDDRARRTLVVVGIGLVVAGVIGVGWWTVYAWHSEELLSGIDSMRSGPSTGHVGTPDFVDRVVLLAQISTDLMLSLLVLAAGLGLAVLAAPRGVAVAAPTSGDAEPFEVTLHGSGTE